MATPKPIVQLAMQLILDEKSQRIALSPDGAAKLTAKLADESGSSELIHSIEALLDFAYFVHHQLKSPAVALALLGVVRTALPALKVQGAEAEALKQRAESLASNASAFEKVTGRLSNSAAPTITRTSSLGWDEQ
jgi:hypothetical protein